jgi:hypothetical protein
MDMGLTAETETHPLSYFGYVHRWPQFSTFSIYIIAYCQETPYIDLCTETGLRVLSNSPAGIFHDPLIYLTSDSTFRPPLYVELGR